MVLRLSLYFSSFFILLYLPESIWEILWQKVLCFYNILKKVFRNNSFLKKSLRGESLLEFMPGLEAKLNMGHKTTTIQIPQYKFYTGLLHDLLAFHQKRGISLKLIIPELRINLMKDLTFEKKITSSLIGANLQFLVITITTWSFIFLSSSMAELPLGLSILLIIFILQLSGVLIFNFLLKKIKDTTFLKFNQSIERLYLFTGLVEAGLPINQTLAESKVMEGELMTHRLFSPCASRLTGLIARWKDSGMSPKTEAAEIIRELWNLKEMSFERFLKHLDLLKFIILAFFFLPAYFFYLYSIFQFFMEQ